MGNNTLGKYCKEKGIKLTLLIEKSGVQKGTLESRWKLGKVKEIDCLIKGVAGDKEIETALEMRMDALEENARLYMDNEKLEEKIREVTFDRDRLLKIADQLTKEKYGVE